MNAIRQFIDVKNNTFNVVLPEGFNSSRVEVIILPSEIEDDIPQWQKEIVLERLKHPQTPVNVLDMIDQLEKENFRKKNNKAISNSSVCASSNQD